MHDILVVCGEKSEIWQKILQAIFSEDLKVEVLKKVHLFFRQRKEAERIEMLAKNALNTSLEAKRLAEETLAMPDKAEKEIQMLRQKYE